MRPLLRPLLLAAAVVAPACSPTAPVPPPGPSAAPSPTRVPFADVVSLKLAGEPAASYRADDDQGVDSPLARKIRAVFPELRLDPCLQRAAAVHLEVPDELSQRLPLAFTEFALHWAGCPDPTAALSVLLTSSTEDRVLIDHIGPLAAGAALTHLGVARGDQPPPYRTRWVVLGVQRRFTLRPIPAAAEAGTSLPLQFRIDRAFAHATIAVTLPRGQVETIDTGISDGWVVASVPLADTTGSQWIELIGHGASGPEVLALFPISIGRPPSRTWLGHVLSDESWIRTPEEAEGFAAELVQRDRLRFGLPALVRDPRLDAIARAHSADMAASGYFAHVSPRTGSVVDRLRTEGYFAAFAAENIAMAPSLGEAQESLMRSPGHRASILMPGADRFGIGVVFTDSDRYGPLRLLTQVFVVEPGS